MTEIYNRRRSVRHTRIMPWKRLSWVTALLLCVLAPGCRREKPELTKPPEQNNKTENKDSRPQIGGETKGLSLVMDDAQGRRLWEIETSNSRQNLSAATATLTDSSVTLFHAGKKDLRLRAPEMKVNALARQLTMWGGIRAESQQRDLSFRVEKLTWNAGTRKFEGTGGVTLNQGGLTIRSDRMSGKTPLETVDLDGNVRFDMNGKK